MTNKKYVKLVLTSANNNNKYYIMEYDGKSSTFNATYGRIESTANRATYPKSKWESKYKEKIRKGYKDVTSLFSETITTDSKPDTYEKISEDSVNRFITLMKQYTDGLVSKTYSVKAKNVTKAQIEEAQKHLDELKKISEKKVTEINSKLLELYMVIPRYMSDVRSHLIPKIRLEDILEKEQDNIDAIASQVKQISKPKTKEKQKNSTLLDILGITMTEIKGHDNIKYLTDQLKTSHKIKAIFEIAKQEHTDIFEKWMKTQKNKETKYLLHGTRCSSVIPIIEQGLKIRPIGNYQFSGKVYGDGNYFSETCLKSLNYTGYDSDKVLLVYEVHTGNPFIYDGWFRGNSFKLTYNELQKRGFDSTFVKAGNGLLNSEIIAYKEEQCHIKYVIWL